MEPELKSSEAVLHATIHITRAATGKVETYQLIGAPVAEEKEPRNGGIPSNGCPHSGR